MAAIRVGLSVAAILLVASLAVAPMADATSGSRFRNPNTPRGGTTASPQPTETATASPGVPGASQPPASPPAEPPSWTKPGMSLVMWFMVLLMVLFSLVMGNFFSSDDWRKPEDMRRRDYERRTDPFSCVLNVMNEPDRPARPR